MNIDPNATESRSAKPASGAPATEVENEADMVFDSHKAGSSEAQRGAKGTAPHLAREFGVQDSLRDYEFPVRLRLYVVDDDPRVAPNDSRTGQLAVEAVDRIVDRVALETAVRSLVLDRMFDISQMDREQLGKVGNEARGTNLALLLGDEAVHHDPLIHPSYKSEVQHAVRRLLAMNTLYPAAKDTENPHINN